MLCIAIDAMVKTNDKERFDDVLALLDSIGQIDGCMVNSYTTTAQEATHTTVTVDLTVYHD